MTKIFTLIAVSAVGNHTTISNLRSHEAVVEGLKFLKRWNDTYPVGTTARIDEVIIVRSTEKTSANVRQSNGMSIEDLIDMYTTHGDVL